MWSCLKAGSLLRPPGGDPFGCQKNPTPHYVLLWFLWCVIARHAQDLSYIQAHTYYMWYNHQNKQAIHIFTKQPKDKMLKLGRLTGKQHFFFYLLIFLLIFHLHSLGGLWNEEEIALCEDVKILWYFGMLARKAFTKKIRIIKREPSTPSTMCRLRPPSLDKCLFLFSLYNIK